MKLCLYKTKFMCTVHLHVHAHIYVPSVLPKNNQGPDGRAWLGRANDHMDSNHSHIKEIPALKACRANMA